MVEELAKDYANYLIQTNIAKEINPIRSSIDEMLTRLDEFETLLTIVKNDSTIIAQHSLPNLFECPEQFKEMCKKIDNLEKFVGIISNNLNILEQHVSMAETELGTNELGITKLLKPIFNRIISGGSSSSGNNNSINNSTNNPGNNNGTQNSEIREYIAPEIFKTSDFIDEQITVNK